MKTLIAASLLLAFPTAAMSATAAEWDCGNGTTISAYKGKFGVWFGPAHEGGEDFPYSAPGVRRFNLTWNFRGPKDMVRLNGRSCKRTD